ncbi:hypothetical protein H4R19_003751 [Coemansia spiralis]|nr:hypothetical protein H4R19_003751 [Coemansia spiralis]
MSMSNESIRPAAKGAAAFRANIAQMFVDRKLLKHLYTFCGLCVVSFLPLIFSAIALSLSTPSSAAKAAIYLTTLAIAFVSIGFSGWLAYQRLCRAIAASGGLPTRGASDVNIISTPAEAFSPSQQLYNMGRADQSDNDDNVQPPPHSVAMRIPDAAIPPVPALPPIGQMPHPPAYQNNTAPQHLPPMPPMPPMVLPLPPMPPMPPMEMPLPPPPAAAPPAAPRLPAAAPPAPPLPPSGLPVPPPVHRNNSKGRDYDGRLSASDSRAHGLGWSADRDSAHYDDEIKLYSFEKVKMQPGRPRGYSQNQRMSRSVPDLNYEDSEYGDDSYGNQHLKHVGSGVLAAPEAAGRSQHQQELRLSVFQANNGRGSSIYEQAAAPQAQRAPAASSIDDLVESMLETYTDTSRPNTTVSNLPPPPVPQPQPRPAATMNPPPVPTSGQRRYDDGDFLDSESDAMSSRGMSPSPGPRPDVPADANGRWKPASVNFDNIAAHIAQALNQPGGPQSNLGELRIANMPVTRDSVSIEVRTPDFSPRRAEQLTTPPAQRAVVHTRTPPNGRHQRYEIDSVASSTTFD